jgi:hypothetical protein
VIENRDARGGWNLLAHLFYLRFFDLLYTQAPRAHLENLAANEQRAKNAAANQRKDVACLPKHLNIKFEQVENYVWQNAIVLEECPMAFENVKVSES